MPIDFPTSPTVGNTITSGNVIWTWNGASWDAGGTTLYGAYNKLDSFAAGFNGTATSFTLAVGGANVTAGTQNSLIISINGVVQEPGDAFTVSGSSIIFTEAPPPGASFYGILLGNTGTAATPADGSITTGKLADNSVTTAKLVDGSVTGAKIANYTILSVEMSNTGVTAATYGNATTTPVITVDAAGRITSASNATISAGITTGKSIAMAIVFGG